MAAISTMELTKCYGRLRAVDRLELEIKEGELFALLGLNGAGKTTLIKMLSCLTLPDSGDALVGGFSIRHQPLQVKSLIALSPQDSALAPLLSVKENLELICGIHGFSREKTRTKIGELGQRLSLEELLPRKAGKLSGGQQRRLSLAMALISEPRILFLDEPSLGLDVMARQELWEQILRLKGKTSIILSTHHMEEANALADRVGIIKRGRLMAVGSPRELMAMTGCGDLEGAFIRIVKEEQA